MRLIRVNSLTKKYGKISALDNISFNVEKGDFFGFIGPNGAGKTTTIKSILNLLNYTGEIEIFGEDSQNNNFQKDIGYVPGEANLYENLSVKDQIDYFCRYYPKIDDKYLRRIIELFQIDLDKNISSLSLGNKKKVSIILALMHQPKLLVFDEVSNGLDPLMQKNLFEELVRLNESGVTIFFSSHNLEEVQNYCKNVAIIRQGKIIAIDNISKILKEMGMEVTVASKDPLNPDWLRKNAVNPKFLGKNKAQFIFKKDIRLLLDYLNKINVTYFRINDVKLEDIFSDYYTKESKK